MILGLSEHNEWFEWIRKRKNDAFLHDLNRFIDDLRLDNKRIYPSSQQVLRAWNLTPISDVKIVILGQDPYHGPNQANGLCFSVNRGVSLPPSLKNIFKEIKRDLPNVLHEHGDLESWAKQGVFLLNSILTVEEGRPLSHKNIGWERFTLATIRRFANLERPIVFMVWGGNAAQLLKGVDLSRHLVLTTSHPSPLSVYRGFDGCGHFRRANEWLINQGMDPIDWSIR